MAGAQGWKISVTGWRFALLAALVAFCAGGAAQAAPAAPHVPHLFAQAWIAGTGEEPAAQVQALDADSFVIRQSIKTNFEAPFVYLFFGQKRALLVDTGAQASEEGGVIRPVVDRLLGQWLLAHGVKSIPLVVAHSHSHGDHIAGDAAFAGRPDMQVVGTSRQDVAQFFGVAHWPKDLGRIDLGGRVITVIPTPGHQIAAAMYYDPRLQIMLSGDTLYPGRLYIPVNFMGDARTSVARVVRFARRHRVRAYLGAHIEMTTQPGKDYGHEAPTHPQEHRLELGAAQMELLAKGLQAQLDQADQRQVHRDFIIVTVSPRDQ